MTSTVGWFDVCWN